jgi:hypothetical protein
MRTVLMCALALLTPSLAAAQSDREAVVAAVQGFFDSMAARDTELAKRLLVLEGRFVLVNEQDGKTNVRTRSIQEFVDGLATGKGKLLERMWEPEVRVHGPLATLWTRYDFYVDGKFSHCGVDAFELVKTADGWKISGGAYTVERTNCPASPLGPPKEQARSGAGRRAPVPRQARDALSLSKGASDELGGVQPPSRKATAARRSSKREGGGTPPFKQ